MGKWGTHGIGQILKKLVHAIHFGCGFMSMVVKWKIIVDLRLWCSGLHCREVEKHTKFRGY